MIKKILVSQPKPTSDKSPYFDIAERYGVEIVFHPFIKVEALTAKEFRIQKLNVADCTAIVFTSRHAIDHFFTLAKELRLPITEELKYFCVTEQIALYIQKYVQYRKRKIFYGSTGHFADLIPQMAKHKNERYFVPLAENHNDDIKNMLDERRLNHIEGVMYRTVPNNFDADEPFDYDMIILFTPSGVKSLMQSFPHLSTSPIIAMKFTANTVVLRNTPSRSAFRKRQLLVKYLH